MNPSQQVPRPEDSDETRDPAEEQVFAPAEDDGNVFCPDTDDGTVFCPTED